MRVTRNVVAVCVLLLMTEAAPTEPTAASSTASQSTSSCYVGPIDVTVVRPDGTPAAGIPVGVFGMIWYSKTGANPPPIDRRHLTDEHGRFHVESARECMEPTLFYALDEKHALAGFCNVEHKADLRGPHVVRLEAARWVVGRIASREAEERRIKPKVILANLFPREVSNRGLRYVPSIQKSSEFRFLVPPGDYWLEINSDHLKPTQPTKIEVPSGSAMIDLGTFDRPLKTALRLQGRPAPPWHVTRWTDGAAHDLAGLRGKPVVVCFWQWRMNPAGTMSEFLKIAKRLTRSQVPVYLICPDEPGGLAAAQTTLRNGQLDHANLFDTDVEMEHWPFPVGFDPPGTMSHSGRTAEAYCGEDSSYAVFVIDGAGTVVASHYLTEEFDAAIERLCR